jgi:hypothetical protein
MLARPPLIAEAAQTRVAYMTQMMQRPSVGQTVLAKGADLLKTTLPIAGVLLLTLAGVQMILGGRPKILGGQ